jgi:hypothetical protein
MAATGPIAGRSVTAGDGAPRAVPLHRRFRPVPKPVRRGRRRAWPAGLLGMVALVAAVEAAVKRHWEVLTAPVAFSWRWSAEAAAREAVGCRVLCAGDSLVKHGLIPRVVEDRTGRRAYNFAAAAAPASLTYFVLRRAFAAGSRPDALVIDFKPSMLAGGPRYGLRNWPEVLTPGETCDLIREARGGAFAAELLLAELLPTFRARHDLRDALRAALRGETPRLRAMNAICRRNWSVNAGANIAARRPGYDGAMTETEHRELLSDRFGNHRVNASYVRRTLDLAAAHGVRTYLIIPPLAPALLARRGQTGAEEGYTAFLRSLRQHDPTLTVLDARPSGYPPSVFVDPIHLDRRGATALSAAVSGILRDDLNRRADEPPRRPPGRWVVLPPYRDTPEPSLMEDVEQSRERLGIAWRP